MSSPHPLDPASAQEYLAGRDILVAAVTSANDDFPAVCDAIQDRVFTLKKLVGATALVIAALIVIS